MKFGSFTMILRTEDHIWNTSRASKKFKTKASVGKLMFTVFWNSEGVVLTGLLEKVLQ
jgi:Transposase.